MNSKVYKSCGVPHCVNTSIKTPNKLFIYVPNNKTTRTKWLKLARRDPNAVKVNTSFYFCEDHFDLPNDMANYMEYHVMGAVGHIRMIPKCVPSRFECQSGSKRTSTTTPHVKRKQRKIMIESETDLDREEVSENFEALDNTESEQNEIEIPIKSEFENETETCNEAQDIQPMESDFTSIHEELIIKEESIDIEDHNLEENSPQDKAEMQQDNEEDSDNTETAQSISPAKNHPTVEQIPPNTQPSPVVLDTAIKDIKKMIHLQQDILSYQVTVVRTMEQNHHVHKDQNREIITQIKNIRDEQKSLNEKVSALSVQMDEAVAQINAMSSSYLNQYNFTSNYVKAIDSIGELNHLEVLLSDLEDSSQYTSFMNKYSTLCSGQKTAMECAHILVDAMFTRGFVDRCSWCDSKEGKKIPLKRYKHVLSFFWDVVHRCNEMYTPKDNELFFKSIILNSGIRKMSKPTILKR